MCDATLLINDTQETFLLIFSLENRASSKRKSCVERVSKMEKEEFPPSSGFLRCVADSRRTLTIEMTIFISTSAFSYIRSVVEDASTVSSEVAVEQTGMIREIVEENFF